MLKERHHRIEPLNFPVAKSTDAYISVEPFHLFPVSLKHMAKIFAQHAQVGELHLETNYIEPHRWEWAVIRRDHVRIFDGKSETLAAAKEAAAEAAGLDASKINWEPIGPALENLPD